MTAEFDIHQRLTDDYGEFDEDAVLRYRDALMDRFSTSPEAQEVLTEFRGVGWADTFMTFAMTYLGVPLTEMTSVEVDEIVFELFPAKVSAQPGAGAEILAELRAFWAFLLREFQLENAGAILTMLQRVRARHLEQELQNPNNFGMAKSFHMLGQQSGFDMTTEAGMQEFAAIYNAALSSNPMPATSYRVEPPGDTHHRKSAGAAKKAVHRKMASASRKKNRKK
jgi:hypothetical protein